MSCGCKRFFAINPDKLLSAKIKKLQIVSRDMQEKFILVHVRFPLLPILFVR